VPLTIDIPAEARDPLVASLDLSALDDGDLLNLILQRSEVLEGLPRPGQIIRAWNAGDEGPIRRAVEVLGPDVARRAAGVIHAEYRALRPLLAGLAPGRIADIGCGYAFFDLFAARDLGASVLLIDLEANERRHFGFQPEGAAYSSLAVARALLVANGVPDDRIATLNPGTADPVAAGPVDLAVSFLSCGFHYPVSLYAGFFRQAVRPGGSVIVDLRAATATAQAAELAVLGTLDDLDAPPKARRVHLRKAAP
jgi:SAM-dependent methyltransferase